MAFCNDLYESKDIARKKKHERIHNKVWAIVDSHGVAKSKSKSK